MFNDVTFCVLAHNEAHCLGNCIDSIQPWSGEIIVGDDTSTDETEEIAYSRKARVVKIPFPVKEYGFALAANFLLAEARKPWTLIIDADELISDIKVLAILKNHKLNRWFLPRRKWKNWKKKVRDEYDVYPDWQIRFFRTCKENMFSGEMHPVLAGNIKAGYAFNGPHIEHLQEENRNFYKLSHREKIYPRLAMKQGVLVVGGQKLIEDLS